MAASSSQQCAPESCPLGDLLGILPSAARQTLYAALKSNSSLSAARLSSRVLRDFIDGHAPELKLDMGRFNLGHHLPLCHEGRWLRRWPRCTDVTIEFDVDAVSLLVLPFNTAPPEACQRITSLTVCSSTDSVYLPSDALLTLTGRLTGLTTLQLMASCPDSDADEEYETLQKPLIAYALSLLPKLCDLKTDSWGHVSCISDGMAAGQLTRLELNASDPDSARPPMPELVGLLGRMTALRELVLSDTESALSFREEALELLDAIPDTLQALEVSPVGRGYLCLRLAFAGGRVSTAAVRPCFGGLASYAPASATLASVLLPSRKLGPRLQRLELGGVDIRPTDDAGAAAALYARCDKVVVEEMVVREGAEEAALGVMRLTGLPATLEWRSDWPSHGSVLLRPPNSAAGRPVGLSPSAVGQRAVERMAAADGPGATSVLVRGPAVRVLLAAPAAATLWVEQLVRGATQIEEPERPQCTLYTLPSAGAIMLKCASPEAAEAVAAAARRLAQTAASEDGAGAGAGAALLDVRRSSLHWHDATTQVLQALWDGEEGGVEEAGGAGAEAPGGGGGIAPTSGACTPAELERVRCLMETWRGLRPHSDP
ncbi:hypothetical protein HYH03_017847 [Edaphochlamys debaryana]|uniref:Uncharacterized protein n=1 Tax=Edaphochlamys debaryana TaxID=47281 RepID=A0A836BQ02_9CHLO|nr:hypothetical protein HYH03_017847 [Edaphochlamys debaryana]|eukprot:KAG2483249.1 hypothetical protein HYH03_017847 [Edaphochlamys debaryana]